MTMLNKIGLGAVLVATTLTAASPAEAQRYRYRDRDRGGDVAAAAIVGGIAGIVIGSALADRDRGRYRGYDRRWDNRGWDDRRWDYDRRYYRDRGYYPANGYYAQRYRDHRRCDVRRVWDPYEGRRVRVRYCY
ncbi:hypothetical protein ACNI3Q_05575 [Sphingomonas sp. FW199]|uniref:hypothetical protein n=1 Tax=Sphingomonas sp. FW199 TaxID=3400217 RepID=UPI003CEA664E